MMSLHFSYFKPGAGVVKRKDEQLPDLNGPLLQQIDFCDW